MEFEADLNAEFASKEYRLDVSVYSEIPFSERGNVSTAKQAEISGIIQSMIARKDEQKPLYIDVDVKNSKIVLAFASSKVVGVNLNDPIVTNPAPVSCTTFPQRLARARSCSPDRFGGATNLRPNGGYPQQFCSTGTFCDGTQDVLCGGLGRIAKAFKANIPMPDNLLYYTDIIEIGLLGSSIPRIDGSIALEVIEKHTPNLWYRDLPGIQHPLCFTNANLNSYYCQVWTELLSVLPQGYYVIDITLAKLDNHFNPDTGVNNGTNWYITFKVAKAVQCPDCSC